MTTRTLLWRYTIFAVLAICLNLLSQRISLAVYAGPAAIAVAIGFGTAVGLAVKYVLDKTWIFGDSRSGASDHAKLFGLYTLTGVFTTSVFWGMEYSFWIFWETHLMREIGAVIGLAIGYGTKYHLDKRFVFADTADPAVETA